jgi:outer membrane protein OmpA-like peptidoglycan-associated protein
VVPASSRREVSTSAARLKWLLSPASLDSGVDRQALAGLLLLELARSVDASIDTEPSGIVPFDPRLEQLRYLLLGREIELSRHFGQVLDDPEQLAIAVSRVLPAAVAQAAARSASLAWIQRARVEPDAAGWRAAGGSVAGAGCQRGGTRQAAKAIQAKEIRFEYNNPLSASGQEGTLDQLAVELKELAALSSMLPATTRVMLTGHSDSTGQGIYNLALSVARAESVRTMLKQRGVDLDLLAVRSTGTLEPRVQGDTEAVRSLNRRVSFTVGIDE